MTGIIALDRDERLIARIETLMADPPEGSVVLEITPAVAKHALKHWNSRNRREKPSAVKRYTEDMRNHRWALNGSTVVFTNALRLGDGQNRMMACVRADIAFKVHVVFGVPDEYFFTIDQGKVRNPDDVLHLEGVTNSRIIAQAVRWAELLATGRAKQRTIFTPREILELWRSKHKAVEDFYAEARRIASRNRQPTGLVMACLYTFDKIDSDFAAEFSEQWEMGTYQPRFRAIGTMQVELLKLSNIASGRIHDVVRAAMIVNAWNACRKGTGSYGAVIRWDKNKPFPKIE